MARLRCPEEPGVALHLVRRGGAAEPAAALARLRDAATEHRCPVHAYVLMGSHVHLLATPGTRDAASRMLLALGGEVDATPVIAPRYLLACMRYIELNPVRAGIVRRPAQYPWSSYRANALGLADALVTPHPWYFALGRTPQARCAAWRARTRG
jgi:REP-associated tyrosine transposase